MGSKAKRVYGSVGDRFFEANLKITLTDGEEATISLDIIRDLTPDEVTALAFGEPGITSDEGNIKIYREVE